MSNSLRAHGIFGRLVQRAALVGALSAGALGCGSSNSDSASTTQVARLHASSSIGSGVVRPASVPNHFIPTPGGWFDPACVVRVGTQERVLADGSVARTNGSIAGAVPACPSPHYSADGREIGDASTNSGGPIAQSVQPPSWIDWMESFALGPLSRLHARWTVPATPTEATYQTLYFFAGMRSQPNTAILQPVLSWDEVGQWQIWSWNCCIQGNVWHSDPLPVTPGTVIDGDAWAANCRFSGLCTDWIVETHAGDGRVTVLQTTATLPMDALFGAVFEGYGVDSCAKLPPNQGITFSNFEFRNSPSAEVVPTPAWTPQSGGTAKRCSYGGSSSGNSATLTWSTQPPTVCTPGDIRDCCPYAKGCACSGEQTCKPDGSGWGGCFGAHPRGTPCN